MGILVEGTHNAMSVERISIFDMLKIGVGPSSSHTMGPWRGAQRFLASLSPRSVHDVNQIHVDLYGSLAKTGRGHGTDVAIQLGLAGEDPETIDVSQITSKINRIAETRRLNLAGSHWIEFAPDQSIRFHFREQLPFHPNGFRLVATFEDGSTTEGVYFSVGGGFVVEEGEAVDESSHELPFPINHAVDLLRHCEQESCCIAEIVLQNELTWRTEDEIDRRIRAIREAMFACIHRGCRTEGVLPGGLDVERRASGIARRLLGTEVPENVEEFIEAVKRQARDFQRVLDWVSCFALAVNEENADFGRIVTAPTNGAAGVIPAVLMYGECFGDFSSETFRDFLFVAGEIGCLFKKGATISAALGGCQAEIGVSSAMAAAALTECRGGTPAQATDAAEIAMEHHLGMTCDPIGGLVQVPCIERNSMGAIKAITATQLALQHRENDAVVSLDAVIKAMWQTAQDMNSRYKETSEAGLAIQVPVNVIEC
ncbi:MAG: L-serine ammonia-lyase [Planctomycetota bacterium]